MTSALEKLIDLLWVVDPGPQGWRPRNTSIPLDELRKWMKSEDIEVLGHTYVVLNDSRFYVDPLLPEDEYREFAMHYYERGLHENPDGDCSDTRYSAGWDIVRWFVRLWDDIATPRSVLGEIKAWIERLYKEGNDTLRKCLI